MTGPRKRMALGGLTLFLLALATHAGAQTITTFAGGGVGDGAPATRGALNMPHGVAVDASGNLFIADRVNNRIRQVGGPPTISGLSVSSGTQGTAVRTVLAGTNLAFASVDFGAGIGVTVVANTGASLTVDLAISGSAGTGPRPFSATTLFGFAASGAITFTVQASGPPPAPPLEPPPPPPTVAVTVPGVERMVPIVPVDPPTQQGVGQALARVVQSASPTALVTQAPDSGILIVQTAEDRQFSFLPLGVSSGHGLHRAVAPGLTVDPFSGTTTVTPPQGTQVELMGAPPDLAGFLDLLRPFGVTGLTIERGRFVVQTTSADLTGLVRLDFELQRVGSPPGAVPLPDGTGQVTYPAGRTQLAVPVFDDLPGFLESLELQPPAFLPGRPDVRGFQPQADGTVQAVINGQPLRFRPSFTVQDSAGGTKRQMVQEAPDTFTFTDGDGRRQRFTIVP